MTLFFALLLALAVALGWRPAPRRRLAAIAVAALFLWSWDPFTAAFSGTLERQIPKGPPPDDTQAIVVLSGNIYPPDATQPQLLPGYSTYLRCAHAAWLYRRWKAVPVLATGGPVWSDGRVFDSAEAMRRTLEGEGVPPGAIWTEHQSKSTRDNAVYSAALLRSHGIERIALVTEAFHMPRALRAFRAAGLKAYPAATAYRTARFEWGARELLLPRADNIVVNEANLHEWVGLAWYAVSGKFSATPATPRP